MIIDAMKNKIKGKSLRVPNRGGSAPRLSTWPQPSTASAQGQFLMSPLWNRLWDSNTAVSEPQNREAFPGRTEGGSVGCPRWGERCFQFPQTCHPACPCALLCGSHAPAHTPQAVAQHRESLCWVSNDLKGPCGPRNGTTDRHALKQDTGSLAPTPSPAFFLSYGVIGFVPPCSGLPHFQRNRANLWWTGTSNSVSENKLLPFRCLSS